MNLQESLNNFEAILESDRYAREQMKKYHTATDKYTDKMTDIMTGKGGVSGTVKAVKAVNDYKKDLKPIKTYDENGKKRDLVKTPAANGKEGKGSFTSRDGKNYSLRDPKMGSKFGDTFNLMSNDLHRKINTRTAIDNYRNPKHKSTQHEAVEELGRFVADIAKLYECGKCTENDELVSEVLDEAAKILMDVE